MSGPPSTDNGSNESVFEPLSWEQIEQRLDTLPARPGCYVFRDRKGEVLYVGKAKSLRSRVRSYFLPGSSDDRAFLPWLRRLLGGFETVVTQSEKEAAILENSLIKEQRPRFNVKLRDDKEFLTLRLQLDKQWPRLELVRRPPVDRARYFGPYHSATAARRTLQLVEKHFRLRTCTDRELASRDRPCLQFQIKRCDAPCVFEVEPEQYAQQVRAVELFLDGRHDELTDRLHQEMAAASDSLEFEKAAIYRDQLRAIESIRQEQHVVASTDVDQDVLGLYREGDLVELSTLRVRAGRVVETASYSRSRTELPDRELVAGYLRERYDHSVLGALIPDEILVPVLPDGVEGVEQWLTDCRAAVGHRRKRVRVLRPERGSRVDLLRLAGDNARHAFEEKRRADLDVEHRLERIQARLRLPVMPRRIECIDISHLAGQDAFGAVVALTDGAPDNARYRSFRIKTADPGDDYGAIFEVLSRRFRRARAEGDDAEAWELPDLLVVDGGRGQLAVALAAAADLGLHSLSIVGLAKEREKADGDRVVDRVYLPGQKNPVKLEPNAPELFILALARDEAHRFSNRSRARAGKKRRLRSELEQVAGVGPKTRAALQRHIGGLERIANASDERLLAVPGVTRRHVVALRQFIDRDTAGGGSESGGTAGGDPMGAESEHVDPAAG